MFFNRLQYPVVHPQYLTCRFFASGTSIEVYETYNEISTYLEEALDDLDS